MTACRPGESHSWEIDEPYVDLDIDNNVITVIERCGSWGCFAKRETEYAVLLVDQKVREHKEVLADMDEITRGVI